MSWTIEEIREEYAEWLEYIEETAISFPNWLQMRRDVKASEVPAVCQWIWVRFSEDNTWKKRRFARFTKKGNVMCFIPGKNAVQLNQICPWDHYSLTKPTK